MKVSHAWLKDYVGESIPSPEGIEKLLTFHAFEIEGVEEMVGDSVIDVDVLPNRSSDCLCHRGIAREIATLIGHPLAHDPLQLRTSDVLSKTDLIDIEIEDSKACPRFTATLITGIEVKDSPQWLQDRLKVIGQRSINNIVDATNYVMFALGQPLHAYDADLFPQVDGKWQFGVRYAKKGEVVSLIAEGGKEEDRDVELDGTEVLVTDRSSNTPIGLAGVKGGRFAGVHTGTNKVIIEAAHFHPIITRKTARRLGIVIDASKRFENEPSRELPPYAQAEIVKLILDIAGGKNEGTADVYLEKLSPVSVKVPVAQANSLLGLDLSIQAMADILVRVGCVVTVSEDTITATGPWERTDLNIAEDFIEEIGRVYGYEHVESVVPDTVPLIELNARHYYSEKVRAALVRIGFSEVITSSFRKKDEISLLNALASDKGCMRSSLKNNLQEVLDRNVHFTDLLGTNDIRVFEIGTVFKKGKTNIEEHVSLCLGVRTKSSGFTKKDEEVLSLAISEITNELDTNLSFTGFDGVTEINFTEVVKSLPVPTEYDPVEAESDIAYQAFSIYPHMSRDIALWVSDSPGENLTKEIESVLNAAAGPLRVRTTMFDEFTKDDKTSYAFRIVFQSNEKTLTDEEVNIEMDRVYKAVEGKGWETR